MTNFKTLAIVAAAAVGLCATAASATPWQAHHPRRAEVNARLANQNARIDAGRRDGQLTRREARQLHREDRSIRREERFDARLDHGHITRAEKTALNQQENAVSKKIYAERH